MGKIMYKGQEFQGRIERVESGGGIVYEEDRDYEWDFTRSEHPELDINYGEPIFIVKPDYVEFSARGLQIGKIVSGSVKNAGVAIPMGNTDVIYWEYPNPIVGKTIEIDIDELLALRKPNTPSSSSITNYFRMFMYSFVNGLTREDSGGFQITTNTTISSDSGLVYTQKNTPQESGWCVNDYNAGGMSSTLTPETVAYDSIDYFNGKTLKFEFTSISEGAYSNNCYLYRIYVDNVLLTTKSYHIKNKGYIREFVINPYYNQQNTSENGMQGTIISGVRVYKNQWYEPKFQPEQQGGD